MRIKFSILVPLYNTPEKYLCEMLDSVQNQTYKKWELCLANASDEKHAYVSEIVQTYVKKDTRIRYTKLNANKGISENTNACIRISTGNYFVLLDHDDVLHKNALKEVAKVICKEKADFIYTDEAKFTSSVQEWFEPNYKPDFAKYELRAHNYICHLTAYSRELLEQVGRYRKKFDGSQDYDMVLRLTEKAKHVVHIQKILYFWRVHNGSVSAGADNKLYAIDAAKNAIYEQLIRSEERGEVITYAPLSLRFHTLYELEKNYCITIVLFGTPSIEVIVKCIESIEFYAGYEDYEYLIFTEKECLSSFEIALQHMKNIHNYQIISDDYNYAMINKVLKRYGRDYFLFLNANSIVNGNGFLKELLILASRKDVGWVGPKILNNENIIKHAGIALTKAVNIGVVNRFYGEPANSMGYEAGLHHIRNVTALSDECMMIQSDKFWEIGGLSNDWKYYTGIDMCLKAVEKKYNNVWTPYAQMVGLEIEKKPTTKESKLFLKKWKDIYLKEDPYYNKFIREKLDNNHDKNMLYIHLHRLLYLCKMLILKYLKD